MSLILFMALVGQAIPGDPGLLDRLTPGQKQLLICQAAAEKAGSNPERVVGVWKACLEEADRQGLDDVQSAIRGELALAGAAWEASSQPHLAHGEYEERILRVVAIQQGVEYPMDDLLRIYLAYLQSERGRSRMGEYRDLSFRWTNRASLTEAEYTRINELVRRYAEEAGFRWRPFGSAEGASARVLVSGTVRREDRTPAVAGPVLPRVETVVALDEIRFPSKGVRVDGFLATASADAASAQEASDMAARDAARRAVFLLLVKVLEVAFKDTMLPEEIREEVQDPP